MQKHRSTLLFLFPKEHAISRKAMNKGIFSFIVLVHLFLLTGCYEQKKELLQDRFVYCGDSNQDMVYNPQTTPVGGQLNIINQQIFEPLFSTHPRLTPLLVKTWEVNPEHTVYTLTLKDDIKFQKTAWFNPSRPLNASDVVFSFDRVLNPNNLFYYKTNNSSSFPWFDSINLGSLIKTVVALDEQRVQFILNSPSYTFLNYLSSQHTAILSAEYSEQITQLSLSQLMNPSLFVRTIDRYPVGTGPFKLSFTEKQHQIRLARHDQYWQNTPPMKEIIFDLTAKKTGAFVKLLGQDCDVLASSSANQLPVIEKNIRLESIIQPVNNTAFLTLNLNSPRLKSESLRQALYYGINRRQLILRGYNNNGLIAMSLMPSKSRNHLESDPNFKPELAKQLLDKAGLKNITLKLLVPKKSQAFNPNPQKVATILQGQLKELGITLHFVYNQTLTQAIRQQQNYDLILTGWLLESPEPEMTLRPLLSCLKEGDNPLNLSHWCNPEFNAILDLMTQTADPTEEKELVTEANQMIQKEVPLIPLVHNNSYWGYQVSLLGFDFYNYGFGSFSGVYRISEESMETLNNNLSTPELSTGN